MPQAVALLDLAAVDADVREAFGSDQRWDARALFVAMASAGAQVIAYVARGSRCATIWARRNPGAEVVEAETVGERMSADLGRWGAQSYVLVGSGSSALTPAVMNLRRQGRAVDVIYFEQLVSPCLQAAARRFIPFREERVLTLRPRGPLHARAGQYQSRLVPYDRRAGSGVDHRTPLTRNPHPATFDRPFEGQAPAFLARAR